VVVPEASGECALGRLLARDGVLLGRETLAELGVVGLAILLVALLPPLWAGVRRRVHPMAAPVTAAYVAFLVHAGGDWTWQLPAVGLAGLACAAACTGLDKEGSAVTLGRAVRTCGIAVAVVVGALAAWGG
jgi:hypothetical protein